MHPIKVIYGRLLHRWKYFTDLDYANFVDREVEKERRDWEIKKLRYLASAIILSADKSPNERVLKEDRTACMVAASLEPETHVRKETFHVCEPIMTEGVFVRSLF